MQTGVASEDAMVAVGINLHVELFAKLYEVFGIFRAILEMNVIIRHAMYQQQIAMQVVGTSKGGRGFVTFGIFFRGTHETFAVYGIVIVPVVTGATAAPALNTGVPSLMLIMVM